MHHLNFNRLITVQAETPVLTVIQQRSSRWHASILLLLACRSTVPLALATFQSLNLVLLFNIDFFAPFGGESRAGDINIPAFKPGLRGLRFR